MKREQLFLLQLSLFVFSHHFTLDYHVPSPPCIKPLTRKQPSWRRQTLRNRCYLSRPSLGRLGGLAEFIDTVVALPAFKSTLSAIFFRSTNCRFSPFLGDGLWRQPLQTKYPSRKLYKSATHKPGSCLWHIRSRPFDFSDRSRSTNLPHPTESPWSCRIKIKYEVKKILCRWAQCQWSKPPSDNRKLATSILQIPTITGNKAPTPLRGHQPWLVCFSGPINYTIKSLTRDRIRLL